MMNAAIYARVSSDLSDVENSISAQLAECRDYCHRNGLVVAEEHLFVEPEAISGSSDNRPALQQMIRMTKKRPLPFTTIVVLNFSRFMRSFEHAVVYRQKLNQAGVRLISIKEPTDDTASGRLMERMLDIISEYHREHLASETKRGMDENARQGFSIGGRLYGYDRTVVKTVPRGHLESKKVKWTPSPVEASVVRRIFEMYASGLGYKEIAQTLNAENLPSPNDSLWHQVTLKSMLTNEAYLGHRIANKHYERSSRKRGQFRPREEWLVTENAHPAIVSPELFARCQEIRAERNSGNRAATSRRPYMLTGLLVCASCGQSLWGNATTRYNANGERKQYRHYRCRGSEAGICRSTVVDAASLERQVMEALGKALENPEALNAVLAVPSSADASENASAVALGREALAAVRKKINNVLRALEDNDEPDPGIKERLKQLRKQEQVLIDDVNAAAKRTRQVLRQPIGMEDLRDIGKAIPCLEVSERKDLLRMLIDGIRVTMADRSAIITLHGGHKLPVQL